MNPAGAEIPVSIPDSAAVNLAFFGVFIIAVFGLTVLFRNKNLKTNKILHAVLFISASYQLIMGLLHVFGADRVPGGDQAALFNAAVSFINGDYSSLLPQNYMGIYPQQLGQVFIIQAFMSVFKSIDYHFFQMLIVFLNVGTVFTIYSIIKELTDNRAILIAGTLMAGFNPLTIFYTSWVYGDLPSIFFMLSASLMLIRYSKRRKGSYLFFAVDFITLGYLVRKNTLIFIVAFLLVAVIKGIVSKDRKLLVAGVCAIAVPFLVFHLICAGYEKASGIPHSDGLPTASFLYIGLSENGGHCGWYSSFPNDYFTNECDTDRTSEAYMEKAKTRFDSMIHEPGYIKAFYGYKILSQWNEPIYQAAFYNLYHDDVHMEKVVSFVDRVMSFHFDYFLFFTDRLQFIVYAGMLLYFLLSLRKQPDLTWQVLAVTIIGGFLFSIIWEAKARYILPYYIMMFPVSMRGYYLLTDLIPGVKKKSR